MKRGVVALGSLLLFVFGSGLTGARLLLDSIGRVSAFQDLGDKNGYTAKALNWLFLKPWWVSSLLVVSAGGSLIWLMFDAFWRDSNERASNDTNADVITGGKNTIIKDGFIYSGIARTLRPRFVAKFCRNGKSAVFYLEYSFLPIGVMGPVDWSDRRKIEIFHKERFAKDEDVRFDIAYPTNESGQLTWRLGREDQESEPMLGKAYYRGRVVATDGSECEQYVYFFMKYGYSKEEEIDLIGQHLFDASTAWR